MKNRVMFCLLVAALFLFPFSATVVYASDAEEEVIAEDSYNFYDNWNELKQYVAESGFLPEDAAIINALYLNYRELVSVHHEARNVSALLLILVVFETLRIVRSWSKGVGLK